MSQEVFGIFRSVTPLVEPLSLDEAYLDVTENSWGEPLGVEVARRIKRAIREQTGLTASAGVAPNKFLAKIASGWRKPDGLTVIAPERMEAFLQHLPIDALWGVGPVTARRLRAHGIERLVDVRAATRRDAAGGRRLAGVHGSRRWPGGATIAASCPIASSSHTAPSVPMPRTSASSRSCASQLDGLSRICGEWLDAQGAAGRGP